MEEKLLCPNTRARGRTGTGRKKFHESRDRVRTLKEERCRLSSYIMNERHQARQACPCGGVLCRARCQRRMGIFTTYWLDEGTQLEPPFSFCKRSMIIEPASQATSGQNLMSTCMKAPSTAPGVLLNRAIGHVHVAGKPPHKAFVLEGDLLLQPQAALLWSLLASLSSLPPSATRATRHPPSPTSQRYKRKILESSHFNGHLPYPITWQCLTTVSVPTVTETSLPSRGCIGHLWQVLESSHPL